MDKKMFKVVIAGETRMLPEGTTYREIVDESDIHTEAPVILVMVNGKLRELQKRLKSDCTLEFVTTKDHTVLKLISEVCVSCSCVQYMMWQAGKTLIK